MKLQHIVLILIVIVSVVIRFWDIGNIPEGFHADEAAFGYNAYSILKTGRDEYGKPFPLILRSFDDYKGAAYAYLTIPFVHLFGLNEFAVRLPTAIAGILIVLVSAALTLSITKNSSLALLVSAIVSFSPSSIMLSRVQSDPLVAVLFIFLGWFCMDRYVSCKKNIWWISGLTLWVISCFTYASPRVLLVGFIPLLYWYYRQNLNKKGQLIFASVYAGILILTIYLLVGFSGSRFGQVNIFSSQDVILPLQEQIREDGLMNVPALSARMFHNKITDYGRFIVHNYASYFGFDFLFYQSSQPAREKIPNMGFMYLIDLPFLLFGIYKVLRLKKRWGYFFLGLFLFTPLGLAVFSQETPNIHRYYFSIFPGSLLVAYGISQCINFTRKKFRSVTVGVIIILYSINILYFIHELFIHQPLRLPYYRGFAYKEMIYSTHTLSNNYDKIVMTKSNQSPYIYVLFYLQYDPKRYQDLRSPRDYDYTGFDKYVFVPLDCPNVEYRKAIDLQYPDTKVLYINKGGCTVRSDSKLIQTINWRDGVEAFQFVENISTKSAGYKSVQ